MKCTLSFLVFGFLLTPAHAEMTGASGPAAEPTAGVKCSLSLYATAYRVSGAPETKLLEENHKSGLRATWQDCFKFALESAQTMDSTKTMNACNVITRNCVETTGYLSISWKFNDSYIWRSSGEVTAHTARFQPEPKKGSLRYHSSGELY